MADKERRLSLWTVYKNAADFPNLYCARRFELDKSTGDVFAHETLDAVRDWIHREASKFGQGMPYRLDRQVGDLPIIVEVWL